jgi:hypothetical protein
MYVVITSGWAANKVDNKTIPKTEMTEKKFRVQELTQHAFMHPLPFATFCHSFSQRQYVIEIVDTMCTHTKLHVVGPNI